ncbi:hypothetical protein ACUL41_07065 [Virgibacillus natechei]
MGDVVTFKDISYLVVTETIIKRHGKFKSTMRYCNNQLEVTGSEGESIPVPIIIEEKSLQVDGSGSFRVLDNEINITLQDNEINRDTYSLNTEFLLINGNWKVTQHNYTNKGLLILSCESIAMPA